MTEMKPCPFCGEKHDLFVFEYPFKKTGLKGCYVMCKRCGASTGRSETTKEAVKVWNERNEAHE